MQSITNKIEKKYGKLTAFNYMEILLHPVLLPISSIFVWPMSLWASRELLWGRWARYHGFHAHNAINNLFYRTQWININRYGRLAKSPIIGLGQFPLSNWWHLSAIASYFYSYAGAVTTLLGTLIFILAHIVWFQTVDWLWVCIVMMCLLFSSGSYTMAFARQNYQILSWMFMPIALFCLVNEQLIIATIVFFVISVLGVTAFIVSFFLVFVSAINSADPYLFFVMLPATIGILLKLLPIFISGHNLKESIYVIGKLIGLIHIDVRYKRKSMRLTLFNIYFMLLYGLAFFFICLGMERLPVLLIATFLMVIVNQLIFRFADDQSLIIVVAMVFALEVMSAPFNLLALFGFVIAVNPIPVLFKSGQYSKMDTFTPFDTEKVLSKIRSFLNVSSKTRVLFAFEDPEDEYEKVFDGYRVLLEAPLVIAAEKEVHLLPDWYAVMETNYKGATSSIWGREVDEVLNNLDYWDAKFVIIYQDFDTELSSKWLGEFEVVSELNWKEVFDDKTMNQLLLWGKKVPKWWLLKKVN